MDPSYKKTLKAIVLELRHLLEGRYDDNTWHPGDLEQRLAAIGVRRDRDPVPVDELPHLSDNDKHAREVVDAYLTLRQEAGIMLSVAVAEFVRETAYTWANRLIALRCMEARELIDEVILQKEVYGGRSLEHHRLAQRQPKLCSGEDDGLFATLDKVFVERAETLPLLFDPKAPGVALKPSAAALKRCVALLSGAESVNGQNPATDELFKSADALGWAYQYWNTEEKARVFEKVRTQKGAKIEGADIIPATQLYTEPYMVKFLVQNSLGATWAGMRPDTKLTKDWEYFVRDADRAPVEKKPVREITFLDPACGSGHFLVEAFDLFYAMYEEDGDIVKPEEICRSILKNNLFGIDIDERSVQIAEAALWMKAAEKVFDFSKAPTNLVATNIRLPKGKDHLKNFLKQHPEDAVLRPALEVIFEGLEHADELGSLLQIEEPVEKELKHLKAKYNGIRTHGGEQAKLFEPTIIQGKLPFGLESYDDWRKKTVTALKKHFALEAESADLAQAFFGQSVRKGLALFDLLAQRYDVVAANPPYMGSKHFATHQKRYLQTRYLTGKRDLYAMFIIRCLALAMEGGKIAMVTRHSWLFLKYFEALRGTREDTNCGILNQSTIESLVHLGPHAFGEIGGEIVNTVLFSIRNTTPELDNTFTAIRVVDARNPDEKASRLKAALMEQLDPIKTFPKQHSFINIPLSQILYWIPKKILNVFSTLSPLKRQATLREGLHTSNSYRFVRFIWECSDVNGGQRWVKYAKGGGYSKWAGYDEYRCEWEFNGARIDATGQAIIPSRDLYFVNGFSYSKVGGTAFSARVLVNSIFSDAGQAIFPFNGRSVIGFLNTRLASYFLRLLSPTLDFNKGYVELCPIPPFPEDCHGAVGSMIALKKQILSSIPTEDSFDPSALNSGISIYDANSQTIIATNQFVSLLLTLEAANEAAWCDSLGLDDDDIKVYIDDVGMPAGLYPAITEYDKSPKVTNNLQTSVDFGSLPELRNFYSKMTVTSKKLHSTNVTLKKLYALEIGGQTERTKECTDVDEYGHEEDSKLVSIPVPSESFVEELSQKLKIHPISIYWLLKEGIENEGWRCLPEERRITSDRFTVTILRLLGHRWPKQIEANEPIPEWADEDGIIPLTDGAGEQTLLNRVRERIAAEFEGGDVLSIEREFAEIMGKPLDQWLETEFFKRHVKQFKKRPVAWQIQSGKYTRNKKPAFACLIYYHKLDEDLLPKIRTQYVNPLRQRYETELRGIEAVPEDARSERQDKRRVEIEALIEELKEFENTLQRVTTEAFSSKKLETLIAKEKPDKWRSIDGFKEPPTDIDAFLRQECRYSPDINDGVRVNIAPLQKAGLLAANVLNKKDMDKAIDDRAEWRADERRWCRDGKLPQPGWWPETDLDNI